MHLLHKKPYPHTKWLKWSAEHHFPDATKELATIAKRLIGSANKSEVDPEPNLEKTSRRFSDQVITQMVKKGYDGKRLAEWWKEM
jgi:hypothetical protein